ncbi:FdhF/YdeP family oxidoreductase [Pseudactinotalea suaedae]|uniref:FdhF/YdeP family oxidoreductase n=1 Tax=Pseudactinotalea suaedae TaxID=1524924 RepID=UPI0012E10850|nr:FdhF/YdeP family oxidoreductase [Pseudactinotalea suaedae]
MSRAPRSGIDESELEVVEPEVTSVGLPAVTHAMQVALTQMGPVRTAQTLLRVNQKHGFDCPGCAWPDPEHRSPAEFCENGAKAVAEEATTRLVTPEFFARHSLADLARQDDFWLGQQGRITHPMVFDDGATHYRPITWDDAFTLIADELEALDSPDQAVFYTSGRTSNEAAFSYQLMVRGYGTNNLPDCSNMCHESSGAALTASIGVGKGSVSLQDIYDAKLIVVAGQNPGTNHPRMLGALAKAKRRGARVVSVNPLPEAGLIEFKDPQSPLGLAGRGEKLSDLHLPIRLGGDLGLFLGIAKHLLERDEESSEVLDRDFLERYCDGLEPYLAHLRTVPWDEIRTATGLTEAQVRELGEEFVRSPATIVCWAMGLTQHEHAVAMIAEIANVLLLQGNIGRPGAGVCPVRGHSNVQGDRTMGIFERMPERFHDRLDAEFGFASPRDHGYDTVQAIRAMRDGKVGVFMAMGGNFLRATPDTDVTEAATRRCRLTVQVSTKLNRSHVVTGRRALILPALGRTDADVQASGPQRVSVEDSMSAVHASVGRLTPPSPHVRSEVAIVAGIAQQLFAREKAATRGPVLDWAALQGDYRLIRRHIEAVVDGFEDYESRLDQPTGFVLPHPPRDSRSFPTPSGRAQLQVNQLTYPALPEGRVLLQTLRSHDQYNTTIYGDSDRYRGIHHGRRVVLVNPLDIERLGVADGQVVDLVSEWRDGVERRAERFRVVAYPTAVGCAAAYYPETNVLVPLDSVAKGSNTPTSKSVVVRLEPR